MVIFLSIAKGLGKICGQRTSETKVLEFFENFRDFCKHVEKTIVFKQYWFRRHAFAECERVAIALEVVYEWWYHMLYCCFTSSFQSDALLILAYDPTTLQAIRAVTMVDGLPRAASEQKTFRSQTDL